ncbi:MAG: bifunctional phosphoglucose/phosphomannose isomerase [Candidatus Omnitrophica bacterium]|nr:bifunctional phosphoglucose/phosphomannose isomerase [Candidatus Omnitrophota bacterium]
MENLDKSNMWERLLAFPQQIKEAVEIGKKAQSPKPKAQSAYRNIIFSGMGGSAIAGELLKGYLNNEIKIPIFVNRDYSLPNFVSSETLIFINSYSGNTEETLAAYEEARKKKADLVVISSGGELIKKAQRDKVSFMTIPSGMPPRTALAYSFFIPLILLFQYGLISEKKEDISETILTLEKVKREIMEEKENEAKKVSLSFLNKFPIIYTSNSFAAVAIRLKQQLAENSKTLSSVNFLPEMNHNEIVGWEFPYLLRDFRVLFLRDKKENIPIKKRFCVSQEIIKEKAGILEIWSRGESLLARTFSLVYIGDFISYYLALLNKVDPTPVEKIDYLKEQLSKGTDTYQRNSDKGEKC